MHSSASARPSNMLTNVRVWLACLFTVVPLTADPGVDFFETKVRPLLAEKCYACHSEKLSNPRGGLRYDDPRVARSSVVPKDPDASRLIQGIRYQTIGMPPTGKLKDSEIATFVQWVEMGAPIPETLAVRPPDGRSNRDHWAWQPLKPGAGSIDDQIRAKLTQNGLTP